MNWYLMAFQKYAEFNGRARRKEYWMFTLFNIIFLYTLMFIGVLLSQSTGIVGFAFLYFIYALATFIPNLALSVRRLHDVDKSGWFLLIGLIPLIGGIWILVLNCTEGTKGSNQYGFDPKNPNDELEEIGISEN